MIIDVVSLHFGRLFARCVSGLTAVTFAALLVPMAASAAHRFTSLDETVKNADTIVHGKILDASAKWVQDGRGKHIYTYATVAAADYWKGVGARQITVEWPGGTVGEIREDVSESLPLSVGEEVVLFLNKNLRPAVGIYSKCRVTDNVVSGVERHADIASFETNIKNATGAAPAIPLPQIGGVLGKLPDGNDRIQTQTRGGITVTPIGPAGSAQAAALPGVVVPLAGVTAYDNTTFSGYHFAPGTSVAVLDFGTSGGGTVVEFTIGYATSLASPGSVSIYFNTGTSSSSQGSLVKGFTLTGLSGSSSPGTYQAFASTISLAVADQFSLPSGAFGVKCVFDNASTGVLLSSGGTGNTDGLWIGGSYYSSPFSGSPLGSIHFKFNVAAVGPVPSITSISPSSGSAGTDTPVTITGSNFGATQGSSTVNFFFRSGYATIPATNITSWSDTSIVCKVPVGLVGGYPGSAGSGPVTVTTTAGGTSGGYTFIVPFGYGQSKWTGTSPSMTLVINENCADCTGEGAACLSAGTTWNNAGSKFTFINGGATTATTKSYNGANEIMWGALSSSSIIAEATMWSIGSTLVECDIMFNDPDFTWDTSGSPTTQMDVQTIATHEMGHWLSLRDLYGNIGDGVNDNGKIMYGFGGAGQVKRALATGDYDGIRWIYGVAVNDPPTVTINQAVGQPDPTNSAPINFTVVFSETVTGFATGDVTISGTASGSKTATVTGSGATYNVAVTGMTGSGTVIATIAAGVAQDAGGASNLASTSTDNTVTYDNVPPSVTINQALGQPDPTNSTINFMVVFSETVTDFATGDVTISGTAAGSKTATVTGSGGNYNVAVTGMTGSGTVIATIASGVAHDAAGNGNSVSTSTDNTVTYDNVPPSVTINQATGQPDPTNSAPINFTVVFNEAVTGFATGDVTISGTASGSKTATVTGSGSTYNVAVTGMTGSGTVVATIAASVAKDAAGNNNLASTSTDNTVTYDMSPPSLTINQAAGQPDPENSASAPIDFTVVFSETVTGFATGDVTISGTAPGSKTATVTGGGTTYNVAVTGMTGDGTVIATVAINKAQDAASNYNLASSSTDNTVTLYRKTTAYPPTPYVWLDQYGLVTGGNYEAAAASDTDNDGMSAGREYVAGTVPTNAASIFKSSVVKSGGQLRLQWTPDLTGAVPARVYSVYGKSGLASGFSVVSNNIPAGATVPLPSLAPNKFFKMGVTVP